MNQETPMINASSNADTVVKASVSHAVFLGALTNLFHWFQEAVAGYEAKADMDKKLAELAEVIKADPDMPERLQAEWSAYARTLQSAYQSFGRDVVHKLGFDEPAQVRNLALSIARGAFEQTRLRSRNLLIDRIEGALAAR